jgi:NADH:ubiquinone oxidoreductase subunit F (NADH-binding)
MSYDCLADLGSALGTGAVIVINKDVDIVKAFARLSAFYKHESCGQCGPCRQGTAKLEHILDRIANGKGVKSDLPLLEETALVTTNCICALAGAASDPIKGLLKHFRKDIEARLK